MAAGANLPVIFCQIRNKSGTIVKYVSKTTKIMICDVCDGSATESYCTQNRGGWGPRSLPHKGGAIQLGGTYVLYTYILDVK